MNAVDITSAQVALRYRIPNTKEEQTEKAAERLSKKP